MSVELLQAEELARTIAALVESHLGNVRVSETEHVMNRFDGGYVQMHVDMPDGDVFRITVELMP